MKNDERRTLIKPLSVNPSSNPFMMQSHKPIFVSRGFIEHIGSRTLGTHILNVRLAGKRAILFVSILFHIGLSEAQSISDSSKANDTTVSMPISIDSIFKKPITRNITKHSIDTIVVFHTDTLRFNAN